MLTPNHLATIRAALQYWEDEICPHGADAMQPYFDNPDAVPLSANETTQLRSILQDRFLRFVIYAPDRTIISSPTIFETSGEAERQAAPEEGIAAVLLPPRAA